MPKPAEPKLMKILTCSVRDYADNQRRNISAYTLVGPLWSTTTTLNPDLNNAELALKKLAFEHDCEVLVDARYAVSSDPAIKLVSATGLVPIIEKITEELK